jgi:hypothetical protein
MRAETRAASHDSAASATGAGSAASNADESNAAIIGGSSNNQRFIGNMDSSGEFFLYFVLSTEH